MYRLNISPASRMTFGILGLTVSLLLAADYFGMTPDGERSALKQRHHFSELAAVQLSLTVRQKNPAALKSLLWAIVKRNDDVLSGAVRRRDGVLLASYGEHNKLWSVAADNTSTRVQLPIMDGRRAFGQLELMYKPIGAQGPWGIPMAGTIAGLIVFVVLFGSAGYWFYLRRSLTYLNPSSAIPARVRSAMDVLANGVLILDEQERIVLVNKAFASKLGLSSEKLLGRRPSELNWQPSKSREKTVELPWLKTLDNSVDVSGVLLVIESDEQEKIFMVNSSPIIDDDGKRRGAIVGFDDVTEIENKNRQLKLTLKELTKSKRSLKDQNKKLHHMASRDPLTNCHNRRSFYEIFEEGMKFSQSNGQPLSCIMVDIDFFKQVNDLNGHAVGDAVIKRVADVLTQTVREEDVVCRYGGEEFCIMLQGINVFGAEKIADRCRENIAKQDVDGIKVTASFGVTTLCFGAENVEQIINQADEALYISKENGRNCVSSWEDKASIAS